MIQKEMEDKQKRNQRKIISCNSVKSDYFDNLRNQTKKYSEALSYKKKLDKGEIEEKDIPDEFTDIIRKIYIEEIRANQQQVCSITHKYWIIFNY